VYVIKMANDKSLVNTIKSTIYRGELNANRILFLLPNEWDEHYVPVGCPMTDQGGAVELWLSILDRDGTVVIKTGSNYLFVEERKTVSDYYPAEKRELLDALAADVETLKRTKADNLVYNAEDNFLQLSAEGEPIGDKVMMSDDGATSEDAE